MLPEGWPPNRQLCDTTWLDYSPSRSRCKMKLQVKHRCLVGMRLRRSWKLERPPAIPHSLARSAKVVALALLLPATCFQQKFGDVALSRLLEARTMNLSGFGGGIVVLWSYQSTFRELCPGAWGGKWSRCSPQVLKVIQEILQKNHISFHLGLIPGKFTCVFRSCMWGFRLVNQIILMRDPDNCRSPLTIKQYCRRLTDDQYIIPSQPAYDFRTACPKAV